MRESDRMEFTLLMGELCVVYQVEATVELMGVYWKHLYDFDIAQIKNAVDSVIKTSDRFPTISKFTETIERSYSGMKKDWLSPGEIDKLRAEGILP